MRPSCFFFGMALALGSVPALADPPAPVATGQVNGAPDVVLLKSGGMVRGTIAELIPGESVTIQSLSGQLRTFSMADVEYAGPSSGAPGAKQPDTPEAPAAVERQEQTESATSLPSTPALESAPIAPSVQFEGNQPDLVFHVSSGRSVGSVSGTAYSTRGGYGSFGGVVDTHQFQPLCRAPCVSRVEPGIHTFGLSRGDEAPLAATPSLEIVPGSRVRGEYVSHKGFRTAGYVIGIGSLVGGLALMFVSLNANDCDDDEIGCSEMSLEMMYAGAALGLVGGVVGGLMTLKSDEAQVQLVAKPVLSPSTTPQAAAADGQPLIGAMAGAVGSF